jgi:hypothetical protein
MGRKPAARKVGQFEVGEQTLDTQLQPLSFAMIGSGTITTATLSSPATNARRYGSPFAALKGELDRIILL